MSKTRKQKPQESHLLNAIEALSLRGVPYIAVGASGINFYLPQGEAPIATVDLDLFLKPDLKVLSQALNTLSTLGFSFFVGDEPFLDLTDPVVLKNIIRVGGTIRAQHGGAFIDLMTSIVGYDFSTIDCDACEFKVGQGHIRVASLDKLLQSKQLVGRPKDKEFIRTFKARIKKKFNAT